VQTVNHGDIVMESREKLLLSQQLKDSSDHKSGRRRQLQQMLADLQDRQIQGMRALRDRDSAVTGDEGDTAVNEDNLEFSTSLVDMAAARRAAVENALQRVEHGSYGLCEECGDEIPVARLVAVPTAVLCVDCQRLRETSSKQVRSDGPFLWVSPDPAPAATDGDQPGEGEGGDRSARPGGVRRGRPPRTTPEAAIRPNASRKR
jgi:DnaK suppressor protein